MEQSIVPTRQGAEGARTAVFAGRDAHGQMLLRFESQDAGTGRDGVREVAFAADRRLPEWHFAFADTIHSSMGQAHGSVHLLASTGMNRQVLAAGLNLHLDHLSVTVPVDEERVESTLTSVLRRDASAVSVLDYGFDPSLGAREAQRVPLREPELQPASIGSQALDALSPQAAFAPAETPVAIETQTGPLDAENRHYLLDNPDHVLVLLQSEHPVFTEGDIREALRSRLENAATGKDASTARDIEEAFARVMASGHLVELNQPAADGKLQYVTRARAQELQQLDRCVGDMADSKLAVVDAGWRGIDTGTAGEPAGGKPGGDRLSEDQLAASEAMLSDTRLTLVKGHAGTGKTFVLNEVARAWQARGYAVLGGALSARATQGLGGIEGMRTGTLAAWEARWSRGDLPKADRFVFVMDEAGMVGTGQWSRITARVAAMGGKLIAVGDPEQLQPVGDVPGWVVAERALERSGQTLPVMGEVRRQRDAGDRAATQALARGGSGIEDAIHHYADTGSLRFTRGVLADPVGAIANAYYTVGMEVDHGDGPTGSRVALAYTNREVRELNGAIRARALERGVVDRSAVRSYGMIERLDVSGGEQQRIAVPLELGPGDRIMLTRPHRDLDLPRSSFGTVLATREHEIDLAVDGRSKAVTIDLNEFRDIDYGYAATVHKSQGLTVDHALVLGHGRMHRHAVYVALSRHRESVTVYGRNRHLTSPEDLIRLAQRSGHLSVDSEGKPAVDDASDAPSASMVAGAEVLGIARRGDWQGSGVDERPLGRAEAGFVDDSHLMAVAERVAGLLAADHVVGDPVLKEDPDTGEVLDADGYAREPTKVIDALLERRSVIRADHVASELSRVVADPETFLRLFRDAMVRIPMKPDTDSDQYPVTHSDFMPDSIPI